MHGFPSLSEDRGIAALQPEDLNVYSAGVSTAGWAEIRMAKLLTKRRITATTIDPDGAEFSRELIEREGATGQISVTIEDLRHALPHKNETFDFVYARLVLHYLSRCDLDNALCELHRILKPKRRIFVVVLSTDCPVAKTPGAEYQPSTGLTTIKTERGVYSRYFHTKDTLREHLERSGFSIDYMQSYEEILCWDYARKCLAQTTSSLIETVATKT